MFRKGTWQRVVLVVLGGLLLLVLIAGALFFCFQIAREGGQIYIVVNDGLVKRASFIVNNADSDEEDELELRQYFMPEWLARDQLLLENPYGNFSVSNYDYTVEIGGIDVRPWSTRATVQVKELMSRIEAIPLEGQSDQENLTVPEWTAQSYTIHLVKTEGERWYISDMEIVDSPENGN